MRIIFTLFLTFLASLSSAEPSSEVQTLMNRNLTIFDWGMFKLEQKLDSSDINIPLSVSYSWDENQVTIALWNFAINQDPKSMEQTKSDCKKVFGEIDGLLFIEDGADRVEGYCSFCQQFSHNGWTSDALSEAREKVKNRLYYSYSDGSNRCTRKAYGTSIAVSSF